MSAVSHTLYTFGTGASWQSVVGPLAFTSGVSLDNCNVGNFPSARRGVHVLGNSYSAACLQAFDQVVQSDEYSVTVTSSWGASPVAEIPDSSPWDKANDYY